MKIGIVAGANSNLYASTLVVRLAAQQDAPACIILAEEPAWRRLAAHVRVAGGRATLRKLARHYDVGGLPDRDARHYLREYATGRGLAGWDSPLTTLAAGTGARVVRVPSVHDPRATDCVREHGLDLLINTAGVIFKPALLQASRLGMLNAHMARLPRFRGMNVLEWSLWFDQPPAVTVHFVTPSIDLGDILAVRDIPVARDDTISTLRSKSYAVMVEAMAECIAALREGRETRTPQRPEEGKQYFVMHPALARLVEARLAASKTALFARRTLG
ncbi:MAG: hypothetical protein HY718_20660 [Planctomycetes bacterium]|nr:hypothetical protein [Planctomycetota bacterium]